MVEIKHIYFAFQRGRCPYKCSLV